jgi:hypothetical protein
MWTSFRFQFHPTGSPVASNITKALTTCRLLRPPASQLRCRQAPAGTAMMLLSGALWPAGGASAAAGAPGAPAAGLHHQLRDCAGRRAAPAPPRGAPDALRQSARASCPAAFLVPEAERAPDYLGSCFAFAHTNVHKLFWDTPSCVLMCPLACYCVKVACVICLCNGKAVLAGSVGRLLIALDGPPIHPDC